MPTARPGSSLVEVLLALVLVTLTASWALQAAALTERAVGTSAAHRDARHRSAVALADLQALPCDSTTASRTTREARWLLTASRTTSAHERLDHIAVITRRGDTLATGRHRWCSP